MSADRTRHQSFTDRSVLALAEAIMPGSATIPAADEATVARAEEALGELGPTVVKAWRLAQAMLSAAAIRYTGRPFHALSVAAQDALIDRWQGDPVLRKPLGLVGVAYKLVHFDLPPTYAALGGKLNVVNGIESPRWLEQVHRAEEWDQGDEVECEVVVVGTGAGGGVVGRELADRGFAVLFVEEGEHYRRDSFDGSSLGAHRRFYRAACTVGNAVIPIFIGRLVGGSTAVNTGTSYRTPPWVLERWCEEIGTDELSPAAMLRHFDRVEAELQVAPAERQVIGPIGDLMARGCDALGWSHAPVRRNAPGCDGSGFCDFGCRTDARRGTNISYIPPALQSGAVLLTGLRVERVLLEGGRAVGVEGIAKNGRKMRVRASTVILAGGAIPTPLLLLKQGLANRSGEVGKNLSVHPSAALMALFDEEIRGRAYAPQGYVCDQFMREGELIMSAQPDVNMAGMVFPFVGRRLMEATDRFDHIASFGLLLRDTEANGRVRREVGGLPLITYNVRAADVAHAHASMIHAGEMCLAAGAKQLYPVVLGVPPLDGKRGLDQFRKAKLSASDILWTSYHPLGTCKMGHDPRTSVVGLDHQAHDVKGLFIVDASTVPGPLGVNPQITIMAMATRAAEKIAEGLGARGLTEPRATG
jgi:choline dehydrogenase-like flavoprotein